MNSIFIARIFSFPFYEAKKDHAGMPVKGLIVKNLPILMHIIT